MSVIKALSMVSHESFLPLGHRNANCRKLAHIEIFFALLCARCVRCVLDSLPEILNRLIRQDTILKRGRIAIAHR